MEIFLPEVFGLNGKTEYSNHVGLSTVASRVEFIRSLYLDPFSMVWHIENIWVGTEMHYIFPYGQKLLLIRICT